MSEKVKKSKWKKVLKWFLWTVLTLVVLLLIAIGIALNFVFTPAKLTPKVQQLAAEYLDAEVHVGGIELTFFSTFPDFGLKVSDASVVSRKFRDTTALASAKDSLMFVKECLVTVNPMAFLKKNRIVVKDFVLDRPQIYAYVDSLGHANWDILRLPADTTTVAGTEADTVTESIASGIRLKNVRIRNGKMVFDDRNTHIYTRMNDLNLALDGFLGKRRSRLKMDFSAKNILFWQEGKLLVSRLNFGLETGMKINRDSMLYTLEKAVFDVNGIRFGAGGRLQADTVNRTLAVDLKYGIHIPSLATLLEMIPDAVLQKNRKADVRGDILCTGTITGLYGKKNIPLLTSQFKITNGYIAYEGMPSRIEELNTDFFARIDLQKEAPSYIKLNNFCMKGGKTDIDLVGEVENVLGDPVIKAKLDADIDFDDLTRIFPLTDGVTCTGKIGASLKTKVLLSDVLNGDYGRIKVGGWCKMNDVSLFVPKDSIVMNIRSAGVGFATNRKNENVVQGLDFLNGVIGYSGLDIYVKNKVRISMDTTYLTLKTTPLKDTSAIATINSSLHIGKTVVIVRDTLLLGVKRLDAKAGLMPTKRNKSIPRIEADLEVDSLRVRALNNRLNITKADIHVEAVRSRQNERIWIPTGYIDFQGLRAYTPFFPLRIRMPGTRIHFNRKEIMLDSAVMKIGKSDVRLTGKISNLTRAILRKEEVRAELMIQSKMINCNQMMRALDMGTVYMEKVAAGYKEEITTEEDDIDRVPVVSDSVSYGGASSVFVVPAGIDFVFRMDIDKVLFGNLIMENIHGEMAMKNQCIQVSDLEMRSSAANMDASLIYKASDSSRAYTGFALKMHEIRIDSLVRVVPALDTLFPMLRSFEGVVDFHIAAETWLDSTMMVELPTLRAAAYLDGHDLVLMDGETFAEISKMLMFKNKKRNLIDSVSVDIAIKNGVVEIFPFMLEIDRYKVAVGGEHNIDMSFKYHISLLKSILPFRAGVDVSGTLDKMKFHITKAKYKDIFIPSRKTKVDSTQLNLRQRMRTMLREGSRKEQVDTIRSRP